MKKILILFFLYFFTLFTQASLADELIIEPDAGRAPLLSAIANAKSSIDLAMYGFTDNVFANALIQEKNTGKNIRILLEPQPYKADDENVNIIKQLQKANVNLNWPDAQFKLIHQKTFILDKHKAIAMTFNLTHSTFTRERNFALVITDPAMVKEIEEVFSADYAHKKINVKNPNLIWSPDNSREKIDALIKQAKSSIEIYAQDLADYQTIGELAKAARRGVNVKILLSVYPEKMHSKKFKYLKKAGVKIENSDRFIIHAKVIVIDDERAALGSVNLTKESMDDNRELSVITEDKKAIKQLIDTFNRDWNSQLSTKALD